jgi:uncharacterized protein YeeX (DUF496 family)
MNDKLRQFIHEELTFNYWLRRPRNNLLPDYSQALDDMNKGSIELAKGDRAMSLRNVKHDIDTAFSIAEIQKIVNDARINVYDIIDDEIAFDAAVRNNDIAKVKNSIIQTLSKLA